MKSLTVHYIGQVFQRLMHLEGMWYSHSMPWSLAHIFMKLFWKLVLLSGLLLSGVPCVYETFFSRPRIIFQVVMQDRDSVSNYPVVPSITASTWCFPWWSVLECDTINLPGLPIPIFQIILSGTGYLSQLGSTCLAGI